MRTRRQVRRVCGAGIACSIALILAAPPCAADDFLEVAIPSIQIDRGDLSVLFQDNSQSPGVLSGIQTLENRADAPGFDAFDPDARGASAGLNFEHIISGQRDKSNKSALAVERRAFAQAGAPS